MLSTRFGRILCRVFGLVLGVTGERKARGSHNIDEEKRRDGRENRDHSNTPTRSSRKNLEGPAIATHKKKPRYLLISFPRRGIRPRQPWKPSQILLSLSSTSHPLWSRTIENPDVNRGSLTCPFAHLVGRLTHWLIPLYSLCSLAPLRSFIHLFACLLTYLMIPEFVGK